MVDPVIPTLDFSTFVLTNQARNPWVGMKQELKPGLSPVIIDDAHIMEAKAEKNTISLSASATTFTPTPKRITSGSMPFHMPSPYNTGYVSYTPTNSTSDPVVELDTHKFELEKQLQQLQEQQQLVKQQLSCLSNAQIPTPTQSMRARQPSISSLMMPIPETLEEDILVMDDSGESNPTSDSEMEENGTEKSDVFLPNEDQEKQQLLGLQFHNSPPLSGRSNNGRMRSHTAGDVSALDLNADLLYEKLPMDQVMPLSTLMQTPTHREINPNLDAWNQELQRLQALKNPGGFSPAAATAAETMSRLTHLQQIIPTAQMQYAPVSRSISPTGSRERTPPGSRGNSPPLTPKANKHRRSHSFTPSGLSKKAQKAMQTREKNRLKLQEAFKHTLKDEVVTKKINIKKKLHTRKESEEFPHLNERPRVAMATC